MPQPIPQAPQPPVDSVSVLMGGMHGGISPMFLGPTQFARGINISCRGGLAHTRPGWHKLATVPDGISPFQGAARWSLPDGFDAVVMCFAGYLWILHLGTLTFTKIGDSVFTPNTQVFFAQADRYLVISEGQRISAYDWQNGAPVLLYSSVQGQPPGTFKVPPATVMQFCQGRLHMVVPTLPDVVNGVNTPLQTNNQYFVSGDIRMPADPTTLLNYTEIQTINGGGALGMPDSLGSISGMTAFRNSPTGTGVGALVTLCTNGVAAFNVALPRAALNDANGNTVIPGWYQQQIGQVLFFGAGTRSPWSVLPVNNDVVYRGVDGIRFLRYTAGVSESANSNASGGLANQPQSFEVSPWLSTDPAASLPYVSAAFADSRLMMTSQPSITEARSFQGIISMDNAVSQSMTQTAPPAYDGMWTGIPVGQLMTVNYQGQTVPLAVCTDGTVRILDGTRMDDDGTPIESQLTTRSLFSETRSQVKELSLVELWLSGLVGPTSVTVYYRPDKHPYWNQLGETRTFNIAPGSAPQERRGINFVLQKEDGRYTRPGVNSMGIRIGYTYQFLIKITGYAQIEQFIARADFYGTGKNSVLLSEPTVTTIAVDTPDASGFLPGLPSNDFSYKAP